ncbi:hypothetical protein F5B22DRAFT_194862 [Xylaria bambusicola]|uniref:uncharacterized protein n=1 Tax=Xylaria bambusicola TaxID=326684 RepID=UPI002008B82C|nr:uncharacterized protein F5B22DRAFT_194862 [Xylaria bambusicola]KAI0515268.1 hypothetical protein F5B22DRAFT_194862 [Xylaria bambusicola]
MGLPLRMDNIHAPTIPSGPTSRPITNGNAKQLSFAELQQKKNNMEAELKALGGVLDSHGVNMETPLITRDGFPRADLDIAQIRTARSRIIHLKNDYKDLMNAIEKHLHEHFASLQAADNESSTTMPENGATMMGDTLPETLEVPFAKVNSVVSESPAATAGLKPGDEIRNFGYVNKSNHDGLKKVAECVQGNEGQRVLVKISRRANSDSQQGARQELQLYIIPRRNWGGRGLLGCHILPI